MPHAGLVRAGSGLFEGRPLACARFSREVSAPGAMTAMVLRTPPRTLSQASREPMTAKIVAFLPPVQEPIRIDLDRSHRVALSHRYDRIALYSRRDLIEARDSDGVANAETARKARVLG